MPEGAASTLAGAALVAVGAALTGAAGAVLAASIASCTSAFKILPLGPVPAMELMAIPAASAVTLAIGLANTRSPAALTGVEDWLACVVKKVRLQREQQRG